MEVSVRLLGVGQSRVRGVRRDCGAVESRARPFAGLFLAESETEA